MSFYRAIDLDHFYLVYFGTEEREYNNNVNGNYCMQIYSNGRYKSVLHRVRVNSTRPRISVASFHSLPAERAIGPAPELVDDEAGNPRRYMDTDFATFLAYLASADGKNKTFLQSRKLPLHTSS